MPYSKKKLSKKKQIELAEDVGKGYAEHMFERFKDPLFRGPKFTWNVFPEMVAGLAAVGAFTSFPHRIGKDIEQVAYDSAFKRATELVESEKLWGK
jgi:hypothetical protein